ncbi:saccharopine dehydrogenase family protein [Pseudidiomarina taiwanensis]|uniref:Saccharopine dehydrogenase NADP binding domain-containing protein n=1 Tax=Pseudidiomarina taiwanensis TaxID=337250 RepID=A0A432ZF03_9GAMM|nr:saccharopine dehydrogenase NADP-binding domain-containing protein [Pseudidiomarina taiwanensis]RUO76501.1 hypothetical protein CWI83_09100 [Pseudidiomarina taiwanensis]
MKWMIYGVYGYTGKLVAAYAKAQGLTPIVAGRNKAAVQEIAEQHGFEMRTFALDNPAEIAAQLTDIDAVVHCAGPFEITAPPMIEACLQSKTHYLDITGELTVFELAHEHHKRAVEAGVVLCPGVGFDVIPTDCLAAQLKQQMPDTTHLALGFDSASRMSRGTAKTSVRRLAEGGAIRKNGQITTVPLAYATRKIDFGGGEKLAMTIPWGDVSTAYYSTGIPNIEVYIPGSPGLVKRLKRMNLFRFMMGWGWVQRILQKKIDEQPAGPDDKQLEHAITYVWGEVKNSHGEVKTGRLKVMNGYKLTSRGAVDIAQFILEKKPAGGFYTPSKLCGADWVSRYQLAEDNA